MGKNGYFQFKHFCITQNKAAMKVGTDGVLLGSWVNVQNEKKILDVGTGTGLIALMMAQRTPAQIIGIEIEKNAAEEALHNCTISAWNNRLSVQNISFQEFAETSNDRFDLIISNPPFFINDKKSQNNNMAIAKHNDLLPLPDLISGSKKLLADEGKIAFILSVKAAKTMIELVYSAGLFVTRLTEVFPTPQKEANRCLIEISKAKHDMQKNTLTVFENSGGDFSKPYRELTKEFYLNF